MKQEGCDAAVARSKATVKQEGCDAAVVDGEEVGSRRKYAGEVEERKPVVGLKVKAETGKRSAADGEKSFAAAAVVGRYAAGLKNKAVPGDTSTAGGGARSGGGFGRRSGDEESGIDLEARGHISGEGSAAGADRGGRINRPFAGMRFILHGFPHLLKEQVR